MMAARVVNHYKEPMGPDHVCIMRPSKWGNPFRIGIHGTREECIQKYQEWLLGQPELIKDARVELRGKVLRCCCKPQPCHGDILVIIANQEDHP